MKQMTHQRHHSPILPVEYRQHFVKKTFRGYHSQYTGMKKFHETESLPAGLFTTVCWGGSQHLPHYFFKTTIFKFELGRRGRVADLLR
jgi:hypothetical protein